MNKGSNIAILSSNLTGTIGGSELYALRMGELLSEDHHVVIYSEKPKGSRFDAAEFFAQYHVTPLEVRFIDTLPVKNAGKKSVRSIIARKLFNDFLIQRALKKIHREFEIFINCVYGRLPAPPKVKSIHILHFSARQHNPLIPESIDQRIASRYIASYDLFAANSGFTRKWFDKYWGRKAELLCPPIAMRPVTAEECLLKENIILAVDRMVPDKKILEMMKTFAELREACRIPYRFVIIANEDDRYIDYSRLVKHLAKNHGIEVCIDLSYDEIVGFYKQAKIFWHAKGYDVGEKDPFLMEHFGMTTAEAMANGCVPVVIGKAGQDEIVQDGINGLKWYDLKQLREQTLKLIDDYGLYADLQINAIESAKKYLLPAFKKRLLHLMAQI